MPQRYKSIGPRQWFIPGEETHAEEGKGLTRRRGDAEEGREEIWKAEAGEGGAVG